MTPALTDVWLTFNWPSGPPNLMHNAQYFSWKFISLSVARGKSQRNRSQVKNILIMLSSLLHPHLSSYPPICCPLPLLSVTLVVLWNNAGLLWHRNVLRWYGVMVSYDIMFFYKMFSYEIRFSYNIILSFDIKLSIVILLYSSDIILYSVLLWHHEVRPPMISFVLLKWSSYFPLLIIYVPSVSP